MDVSYQHDFEYDWCVSAQNAAKQELSALKNSRWLIFGLGMDPFFEALVRFLHLTSRERQLGLALEILVGTEAYDAAAERFSFAAVRNIDLQETAIRADYCVCCGYIQPATGTLERVEKFWSRIAKPEKRAMYISNTAVYDPYCHPLAAAEGEFRQGTGGEMQAFAGAAEQLLSRHQRSFVILRPGVILGAGLNLVSPVTELLDRLIRQEPIGGISARTKYSLVYITDFLTAFLKAAVTERDNQVYNVCSADATVSLLRVCEAYWETEPQAPETTVTIGEPTPCPSYALDGAKLGSLGWQPLVGLKTMLQMEVMARRGQLQGAYFADGYHGKLSAIHDSLFGILCEIDRICKKHNIRYFLAGGTLLGAVRHRGFIPWDDDLDVMMLRRDYERFLAVAREELPAHLFLQTPSTEPGNHYLISKIRLEDTVFSSEYLMRFPKLHNGLFVDVIAQDYTANSALGQKLHIKLSQLARGLVFKKWSGQSAAVKGKAYAVFDLIKNLLPFGALEKFQHWALTLFAKRPGRKYLYDSMGTNIARGVYPAAWLSEYVDMEFEGRLFPVPVEYDRYLRYLYGDYQQLVPVTQRMSCHEAPWVDLGPYAGKTPAPTESADKTPAGMNS